MLNLSQTDCRNGGVAFAAGEDLSLKAGYLVKLNAGKDLILPTGDQDLTPYVITQGADQGYLCGAVPLSSFMNARVVLDGTCEAGTMLVAKGDGRVTAYTAGSAARVIGVAEEKGVAGQHVLLRPVSVGVKGADGAAGAAGAVGAAGAAGRDAGLLVLPKSAFAAPGALANVASHIGYLVWLVMGMDGYYWCATHGGDSRDEAQYVIIGEDATTVTLFPMGGNASTTAPHTIALPMMLPASVVLFGTPGPAGYIGPAVVGEYVDGYKGLAFAADTSEMIGHGCACMQVISLVDGNLIVIDGGGLLGGT